MNGNNGFQHDGEIVSIAVSKKKGTRKTTTGEVAVLRNHGIDGDAHAGEWHRQISFLSSECIDLAVKEGLNVGYGDFAENFATRGIDWKTLQVGTRVRIGSSVIAEISQIGKECHNRCAIYYQAGDCIMPREGVFARVIEGGTVSLNDKIYIFPEGGC